MPILKAAAKARVANGAVDIAARLNSAGLEDR